MNYLILMGSNEGDRTSYLCEAIHLMDLGIGEVLRESAYYETAAWGHTDQPDFLNKAVELYSDMAPPEVMQALLHIEQEMGRIRTGKWAQRTIDLDMIYAGDEVISLPALTVPHPEMQRRRFVLVPVCDLWPEFLHPVLKLRNRELLTRCEDPLEVRPYIVV